MIKTDYTKCLSCRWRDVNNAQCFDGHLQYNGKLECEGFETPPYKKKSYEKPIIIEVQNENDKRICNRMD